MSIPQQKPGRSEQVVSTPPAFIERLKVRLGIDQFDYDLAADQHNSVVPNRYYDESMNALKQTWRLGPGWNFCNPPYAHIEPWVQKAWHEAAVYDVKTAMLLPASVGSNWWAAYVDGKAYVTLLNGRLTFVGHDAPYPKDLVILLYAPYLRGGYTVWNWQC